MTRSATLPLAHKSPTAIADPWLGTDGPDEKTGTSDWDFLIGLRGGDTLRGMGGDDQINGGAGADRMYGGSGKDRIYVSGTDKAWGGKGVDTFVLLDFDTYDLITDPGTGRIKDFDAKGADHDILDLASFATSWASRDAGLEDGFEMVKSGDNVIVRLEGSEGTVTTIILENTRMADLDRGDFFFG